MTADDVEALHIGVHEIPAQSSMDMKIDKTRRDVVICVIYKIALAIPGTVALRIDVGNPVFFYLYDSL